MLRSINGEYDKQYLHRLKYILYGIMGGFYFSSKYQPWIKYCWFFANFSVILITQFLGTAGYFIMSSATKQIRDIFYALITSNVIILAVFATPCLTYYFQSTIEHILTLAEEEFFANARPDLIQIQAAKSNINKMIILHVASGCFYILIHPVFQFFSGDNDSINNLDYNLFPHIWLGSVQTALQYYIIFVIHCVAAIVTLISFITISIYVYYVGHEFYVASSGLKNFLNDFSTLVRRNFDDASNNVKLCETSQKTILGSDEFKDYKKAKKDNHHELMSNLIAAIQAHQLLYKYVMK